MARKPTCTFCSKPSIVTTRSMPSDETVDRCGDHPPADAPVGTCEFCGRGFWPDFLHLDCYPKPETPGAIEDSERVARPVRRLTRWLRDGR